MLRSVSYHVNEPIVDAAFSEDGSLLGVVYQSVSDLSFIITQHVSLSVSVLLCGTRTHVS